jgi:hypothetical protein
MGAAKKLAVLGMLALATAGCANCPGPNCAVGRGLQGFAAASQYQQPQLPLEMNHRLTLPFERQQNCLMSCPTPTSCTMMCQ